jgi:aspartyl-tRNA synthetase
MFTDVPQRKWLARNTDHGSSAGLDRLIAILAGAKSIREVIAFPKTVGGSDPVFKSPSPAAPDVLKGYGLQGTPKSVEQN